MRLKFRTLVIVLGMALLLGCQQGVDQYTKKSRTRAPGWTLTAASGELISFPAADGQPVLILFWATWCPYCKALMPHIQSILDEFPDSGLVVYAISFRDDGDPATVVAQQGFNFTVLPGGDAVAAAYGIKSTPGVLLVDAEGMTRFDLRDIQAHEAMQAVSTLNLSNSRKAARKAPYYAAAVRKAVDQLLADSSSP